MQAFNNQMMMLELDLLNDLRLTYFMNMNYATLMYSFL